MQLPSWLVYLGAELIILLIVVIVFLMVAWQRSSEKNRKLTVELVEQLKDKKRKLNDCKNQSASSPNAAEQVVEQNQEELKACQEENELLKIQLEQARNNPFLQEKIDALTAENEDLQAELTAIRSQQQ